MANYVKLAATAKRLIEKNGRSVTLERESTTATDSAKPWRGGSTTPAEVVTVIAAVLNNKSAPELSDHVLRGQTFALIAQDSLPGVAVADFDRLLEGDGTSWAVEEVETLNPGDTTIYYKLVLRS